MISVVGIRIVVEDVERQIEVEVVEQALRDRGAGGTVDHRRVRTDVDLIVASLLQFALGDHEVVDVLLPDRERERRVESDVVVDLQIEAERAVDDVELDARADVYAEAEARKTSDDLVDDVRRELDKQRGVVRRDTAQQRLEPRLERIGRLFGRCLALFAAGLAARIAAFGAGGIRRGSSDVDRLLTAVNGGEQFVDDVAQLHALHFVDQTLDHRDQRFDQRRVREVDVEQSETVQLDDRVAFVERHAEQLLLLIDERDVDDRIVTDVAVLDVEFPLDDQRDDRVPFIEIEVDGQIELLTLRRQDVVDDVREVHLAVERMQIHLQLYPRHGDGVEHQLDDLFAVAVEFVEDAGISVRAVAVEDEVELVLQLLRLADGDRIILSAERDLQVEVLIGARRAGRLVFHQSAARLEGDAVESGQVEVVDVDLEAAQVDIAQRHIELIQQRLDRRQREGCIQRLAVETHKDAADVRQFGFGKRCAGVLDNVRRRQRGCRETGAARIASAEQVDEVEAEADVAERGLLAVDLNGELVEQVKHELREVELCAQSRELDVCYVDMAEVDRDIALAVLIVISVDTHQQPCGLSDDGDVVLVLFADVDGFVGFDLDDEFGVGGFLFVETDHDVHTEIHLELAVESPVERYADQLSQAESRDEVADVVLSRCIGEREIHVEVDALERTAQQLAEVVGIALLVAYAGVYPLFEFAVLDADQEVVDGQTDVDALIAGGRDAAGDVYALESALEEDEFELAGDAVGDEVADRVLTGDAHESVDEVEDVVVDIDGVALVVVDGLSVLADLRLIGYLLYIEDDPVAVDFKHAVGDRQDFAKRIDEGAERRAELISAVCERKQVGARRGHTLDGDVFGPAFGAALCAVVGEQCAVDRVSDRRHDPSDEFGHAAEIDNDVVCLPIVGYKTAEGYIKFSFLIIYTHRLVVLVHIAELIERIEFEQDEVVVYEVAARDHVVIEIEVDLRAQLVTEVGFEDDETFGDLYRVGEHLDELADVELFERPVCVAARTEGQIDVELQVGERELSRRTLAGERRVDVVREVEEAFDVIHLVAESDRSDAEVPSRLTVSLFVFGIVVGDVESGMLAYRILAEFRLEHDLVLRYHLFDPVEQRHEVEVEAQQRAEVDETEDVGDTRGEAVQLELDLVVGRKHRLVAVAHGRGDLRVVEEDAEHDTDEAVQTAEQAQRTVEVDACEQPFEQAGHLGDDRRDVVGLHVGDFVKSVFAADVDKQSVFGDIQTERGVVVELLHLEHEVVGLELTGAALLLYVCVQRDQAAFDIRFKGYGHPVGLGADDLGIALEDRLESGVRRLSGDLLLSFVGVELFRPTGIQSTVSARLIGIGDRSAVFDAVLRKEPAAEDISFPCRHEFLRGITARTGDHHQLSRRHRVAAHRVERDQIARIFPLCVERDIARHRVGEGDRLSVRRVEVPTRKGRTRRVCAVIKVAFVDLRIESKSGGRRTVSSAQHDDRRIGVDRLPRGVECGSRRSDRIGIGDRLRKSAVEVPPHECLTGRRCARIGRLRQGRVRLRYRGVSLTVSARQRHRVTGNVVGVEGQRLDILKLIRKRDRLCERLVEVPSREVLPRDVFRVGRFGDGRRTFVALIHLRSGRPVGIDEIDLHAGGMYTACKNQCDRDQDDEDGYRQFGFSHNCSPERQYIYAHASAPRMRISFHNL